MTGTRPLAVIVVAAVVVTALTANVSLGWADGRIADAFQIGYIVALAALIGRPGSPNAHAVALAGAVLFWGGRILAQALALLAGEPRATAVAIHVVALSALIAHHRMAADEISMARAAASDR